MTYAAFILSCVAFIGSLLVLWYERREARMIKMRAREEDRE